MSTHDNPPGISFDDPARHGMTQRVTWISVVVNIFLTAAQVIAGIIAHSQGLIADGLHSLSDLVCDFLVLFAMFLFTIQAPTWVFGSLERRAESWATAMKYSSQLI